MAISKIEHTGIMVKNLNETIEFYTNVLGMELKGTLAHNNPEITLAFLGFPGDDGTLLELISGYNRPLSAEGIVNHIAFTVDDVEAEAKRLRGLGVRFREDQITTLRDGARYTFFYGPNGEQLELFQPAR